MGALELDGVGYRYPGAERDALEDVSFTVAEGSFTALLGPNGAGKTTLVHSVVGLVAPERGTLTAFGDPAGSPAARRAIGFCPQELALYPSLSARENLAFFGRLAGLSRSDRGRRADVALASVRLTDRADERVERFSGGMKRRLNLAVALLAEPRLLVLDEPTVGVDAQSRLAIFAALEAANEAGTTILYTSHYMEEVERLCRDVVVIDHGRVISSGRTEEIARIGAVDALLLAVTGDVEAVLAELAGEGHAVRRTGDRELVVTGTDLAAELAAVESLARRGLIESLQTRRPTLEERFLELTGEGMRDE